METPKNYIDKEFSDLVDETVDNIKQLTALLLRPGEEQIYYKAIQEQLDDENGALDMALACNNIH